MELSSAGQEFTPAAPLHIQRLKKALQLDVLLREAEKVFTEDLRYHHSHFNIFMFMINRHLASLSMDARTTVGASAHRDNKAISSLIQCFW
jgi:hypothetical protein